MSKKCTIKVGGKPCGKVMAQRDYVTHLKSEHSMELIINPIEHYKTVHEQVEHIYDISNAAVNSNGVLVDMVLRSFWRMAIYDQLTKHVQIDLEYDIFIEYLVPLIGTIERAGRDLREEDKKNKKIHEKNPEIPLLHPNWNQTEKVRVMRTSKFLAYHDFFKNRKTMENL